MPAIANLTARMSELLSQALRPWFTGQEEAALIQFGDRAVGASLALITPRIDAIDDALEAADVFGIVDAVSSTAGVVTLDATQTDFFTLQLSENVTSLLFTGLPAGGERIALSVQITQGAGPWSIAWPDSFRWLGAAPATLSAADGAIDILSLVSFDGGVTFLAALGKDFA